MPRKIRANDAEAAARKHREQLLDEALAESFPASDPPAIQITPASPAKSRKARKS